MTTGAPAILALSGLLICVTACQAPGESPPLGTANQATVTAIVTATVEHTVTVTPPPVTVTVTNKTSGPQDVTEAYVTWRRAHHGADSESSRQYGIVQQALLEGGRLDVVTSMPPNFGGWNCAGEPAQITGETVSQIRILYTDGSVFRLCRPGS